MGLDGCGVVGIGVPGGEWCVGFFVDDGIVAGVMIGGDIGNRLVVLGEIDGPARMWPRNC